MKFLIYLFLVLPAFATDRAEVPPPDSGVILYYSPHCPYSKKVLNYLKTSHQQIALKDVTQNKLAVRQLEVYGGYKKVPCLFIDQKPLYGADDIIDWLYKNP